MTDGHGCPHVRSSGPTRRLPSPRAFLKWRSLAIALSLLPTLLAGCLVSLASDLANAQSDAARIDCELRIVWGGDSARPYSGSLSVADGLIKVVRNLSLQSDSIGAIRNQNLQTLSIDPRNPSLFGGVDVTVHGTLSTRLQISLDDPGGGLAKEFDIPLSELQQGNWVQPLDERGNRLAIERQMHDRLRVTSDREPTIFEAGEVWRFNLAGLRTGLPAGQATAEIRFVQGGQAVGAARQLPLVIDSEGNFSSVAVEMETPLQEGAYHLEIAVQRRSYLNSFVSTGQPMLRRLDLVVFDREAQPNTILRWKPLVAIDPYRASQPGSLAWLSTLDVLKPVGLATNMAMPDKLQAYNPLSSSLHQPVSHGKLGARQLAVPSQSATETQQITCLTLEPKAWLAIPLHALATETPHRLRVRVPTDHPMELAFSLQQTNVVGEFPPLSLDSGIYVGPREARDRAGQLGQLPAIGRSQQGPWKTVASTEEMPTESAGSLFAEHELIFWPRGDQAYLVVANLAVESIASVSEIYLERAELAPAHHRVPHSDASVQSRMIGINMDKPLLADCVSASREVDPVTRRPLESWNTWQQSIVRICQLMHARDANTLLVKGFSEGGAIFPSARLEPTPRYDSGTFFSDGRSPDIKDAIELLLRHFDRANLRLVLALDLNTSLPSLARFENVPGQESLLQQPVAEGTILDNSHVPRYNPLNSRVQEELVSIVRDIVDRYGHHPAFAGLAIQLDGQSQLVFAGDRWGYDPQTLAAFEKSAQVNLPPREQLEALFSGSARLAFLDWRAAEMTKFYARLGEVVRADSSQRKLYLNAIRLWDAFPTERQFYNPDAVIRNPREYLLAFGISPERLAQSPQVELMRGSYETMVDSVNAQDWIRRESGQRGLVEFYPGADTSAVLLRHPLRHELESAEKLGHSKARYIYPTLYHPREYARKKLINQIFHSDPLLLVDGGWLPFSGQDTGAGSLVRTLNELPPLKLTQVALRESDTNLCVRQGTHDGKSYLQIINNAPWQENLSIGYQTAAADFTWHALGGRQLATTTIDEPNRWNFAIAPYDMLGIEISDPQFKLTSLQHAPTADTLPTIARELAELETRVSQSADLSQQKLLANVGGDFEQWENNNQPMGWSVSSLPQVKITRSLDLPHTGSASLMLENHGKAPASAWVQSRPIPPPRTGRLAVQAWLRAPAVSDPLLVKLAVVGRTLSGERFERALMIGARGEGTPQIAIDWGRKPATLFVGDVSSESVSELSVSIELIGPGKVWVDDVQVFESCLQPDERNHLRGQLMVAKQKLAENNLYPAEQLLAGHWGRYMFRFHPRAEETTQVAHLAADASPALEAAASGQQAATNSTAKDSLANPHGSWSESPSVFRQLRDSLRDRWRR